MESKFATFGEYDEKHENATKRQVRRGGNEAIKDIRLQLNIAQGQISWTIRYPPCTSTAERSSQARQARRTSPFDMMGSRFVPDRRLKQVAITLQLQISQVAVWTCELVATDRLEEVWAVKR
jgi:hypothetical protein